MPWRSERRRGGHRGNWILGGLVGGVVLCVVAIGGCGRPGGERAGVEPPRTAGVAEAAPARPLEAALPEAAEPIASAPAVPPRVEHGERVEHEVIAATGVGDGARAEGIEEPPAATGPIAVVCPEASAAKAKFFFSPQQPRAGKPLRVVAISEVELGSAALARLDGERPEALSGASGWGGPPYAWSATIEAPAEGTQRFALASDDPAHPYACGEVKLLAAGKTVPPRPIATGAWTITRAWSRELENLYSAWIARLFLVDVGAKAGWRPAHQVLRDPKRNILYGYLGFREDDPEANSKVYLAPDCADTPFFLRAYFSWKMGLPFAVRRCLRGDWINGPICEAEPVTNLDPQWDDVPALVDRFNKFVGLTVANSVHSGTVRTVPDDDSSDFFPVALSREALRPGIAYADPNGHVLVVTRWVPGTAERIGVLLAVDAHPDLTVSHKRFSRANFFFDPRLPTGGFKAFRPAILERGKVRFMTNAELAASPDYGNRSLDQYAFSEPAEFYRTVDRLLNPIPLEPARAYRSHMEALIELLEERVDAVQVGVDYQKANGWSGIAMPEGGAIFETLGPWEEYSTPARDLRLLLAFDELTGFTEFVVDNPDIFAIPAGKTGGQIRADLYAEWERSRDELTITYARSDGSPWTLTLGQLVERVAELEQSYNPNDCVEYRWGARRGSAEFSTCVHRAPFEQQRRMEMYRVWHAERRRPSGF